MPRNPVSPLCPRDVHDLFETAAKLLEREPGGFAGVVAIDAETKIEAGLVLASSSRTDLRQLVRFAREHLK